MSGRIEALWIKRAKRGPMDPADEVEMIEDEGIRGNANQGGWRQVTIIEREAFDAVRGELSPAVDPAMRRANVLVSGLRLAECRGRVLSLGECRIEMRGETRPCERMDEAHPGLRRALDPDWRGGAFGRVVRGGRVRVGDEAVFVDDEAAVENSASRSSMG